jgi:hypothetical protein
VLKASSEVVSVEQLCVWRETGEWVDHSEAILISFSAATVEEVLSKHTAENIHIEGQLDGGPPEILPPRILRSYGYEIVWQQLAGSFLIGSRGTCSVRLFSYARLRGDALNNLDRPANGATTSPDGAMVPGYHCLVTDLCLKRQEAVTTWSATIAASVPASDAARTTNEGLTKRVIDELLCLHLGGPLKYALNDYVDLIGHVDDDLTEELVVAALRNECLRFNQELVTGSPQPWSLGRTSYITRVGKKHTVQWSTVVESLLLHLRFDSPALHSWAALYRLIQQIVGDGQTPTDKAIKVHFRSNYPKFFKTLKAAPKYT